MTEESCRLQPCTSVLDTLHSMTERAVTFKVDKKMRELKLISNEFVIDDEYKAACQGK